MCRKHEIRVGYRIFEICISYLIVATYMYFAWKFEEFIFDHLWKKKKQQSNNISFEKIKSTISLFLQSFNKKTRLISALLPVWKYQHPVDILLLKMSIIRLINISILKNWKIQFFLTTSGGGRKWRQSIWNAFFISNCCRLWSLKVSSLNL